jgi:hypothetical protein
MRTEDGKPSLKPGQLWSLMQPAPKDAKVIIGSLEDWHGQAIVHITIIDIPIGGGADGSAQTTTVGHAPFDKVALIASLGELLAEGQPLSDDFSDSIEEWRMAKGGVWTIGVAEVLQVVF